eukprot:1161773-Pelagomonas_calceolata.AAC.22
MKQHSQQQWCECMGCIGGFQASGGRMWDQIPLLIEVGHCSGAMLCAKPSWLKRGICKSGASAQSH